MQFNRADLDKAGDKLKTIPYYPIDTGAQAAVCEFLAKICPSREALIWVVDTLCETARQWPGLGEVRGLLCWKFPPADGIEADCNLPGFTRQDGERITMERHEENQQMAAGDDKRALADFLDANRFLTPGPKP